MIEFILNNKHIRTEAKSGMTLLDFVRYQQRLTGTKIGCREGDCAACSALAGTLNSDGGIDYQSITSCISPLGNAQGKHIVTIEGVNLTSKLNVAQEAMKRNYATQCGFCTPGFALSLTGFAFSEKEKSYDNVLAAISGNICRCTGYKSIERAAREVAEELSDIDSDNRISWLVKNRFIPEYFLEIPHKLEKIRRKTKNSRRSLLVSGGTDMYVQRPESLIEEDVFLVAAEQKFKGIRIKQHRCFIGANTTVTEFWNNPHIQKMFPNLDKHLTLVSSEPIRNMASFGGNLVNASPIGDMTIFFLALDSTITLKKEDSERQISLKDFYQGYKTYDLQEGEVLSEISFDVLSPNTSFNFEKVCKRTYLDIASVNTAISIELSNTGTVVNAHVAMGGVSPIPKYLRKTSEYLIGKSLDVLTIALAAELLQEEISPISDVRGTKEYKRLLARQLFTAHFTELFPNKFKLQDFLTHAAS
ncbi:FAD binding domain-containing protein [Maribacter sp. 2210JD10-5]|uniref:FAD binding domain-containing protein n=1 Tax=Maribacter sp. 2210JD10-5 TaxID=3386272 RepID=UPI0039BD105F